MAETTEINTTRVRRIRHRGRLSQISIYLGKQMRFFVNENGWKVIPMAAIIAGLVAMVIQKRFFVDMEGSLIGGFALSCVAIWNGCFNSIQVVCRERAIIKREHRSGMHISSYMAAHMLYQLGICLIQTGVTIYVMKLVGVRPLSEQYFSLYTPEMQRLRTRVKPGLLPPFYYDRHTPDTIEEIQASERRYLEAYMKAPHKTDWKYFWGIVANILLHRKRSK